MTYRLLIVSLLLLQLTCGPVSKTAMGQAAAVPGQSGDPLSSRQIDDVVRQVMQAPEFRSVRRRVLQQKAGGEAVESDGILRRSLRSAQQSIRSGLTYVGDWFSWLLRSLFGGSGRRPRRPNTTGSSFLDSVGSSDGKSFAESMARILTAVIVICFTALISWFIVKLVRNRDVQNQKKGFSSISGHGDLPVPDLPPGELPASAYELRARQYANSGDYQAAICELLVGSMSWIERSGLIRYRRGLTNRDYLRSVWKRPSQKHAWVSTSDVFERIVFGRRKPSAEMYENCLSQFQGAFREDETSASAQ